MATTPSSKRAKSAATKTKHFIEQRQAAEIKFREIEHELRVKEIKLRMLNAQKIFKLEEERLNMDQEHLAIKIQIQKLALREAQLKVQASELNSVWKMSLPCTKLQYFLDSFTKTKIQLTF